MTAVNGQACRFTAKVTHSVIIPTKWTANQEPEPAIHDTIIGLSVGFVSIDPAFVKIGCQSSQQKGAFIHRGKAV